MLYIINLIRDEPKKFVNTQFLWQYIIHMNKSDLIKKIEQERGSRLLVYVTGDRQPFLTRVATDVLPLMNQHLSEFGEVDKVSLFLYTSGGDMLAPIRIVKLIRNHCKNFEVLVPYKAHSAGTLVALGADEIVMGKLGELSPVDPSTGHPFNPQNPGNPQRRLEVSVEDLNSYFLFAKERAGVKDDQMVEVYKQLVEKMHPLSIGNAYRAFRMSKMLTERLLRLHMDKNKDKEKIEKIVKEITGDITIHAYPIDVCDAKELGLNVSSPSADLGQAIWDLYSHYAGELKLGQPFHPSEFLGDQEMAQVSYPAAFVDSSEFTHKFVFKGKVQKTIRNNQPVSGMNMDSQSWILEK